MTRIATFLACDAVAAAGLGKLAFVGIYGGEILVPQLPFSLQQLFFVVRFRAPIDDPAKRLVIRIERPGHEPFVLDQSAALALVAPPDHKPDATFLDAQAVIRLAPFDIDREGIVRVFVEDEIGEHYAGGLRLKLGTHPDVSMPRIATSATLAVGHYKRLSDLPRTDRQETATQLIEALSEFISHTGTPIELPFPELDLRLLLDNQRVHVFFPRPLDTASVQIEIEPAATFANWKIERADRIGFVVNFEPSAPADAGFNYTVSEGMKEFPETRVPVEDKETVPKTRRSRARKSRKKNRTSK